MTSHLPPFLRFILLLAAEKKDTKNRAAVTSLRSFLFRDDFTRFRTFSSHSPNFHVKFIYSQKATKFCKISTLLLTYVVPVKSKVEISQNFVAFSEYMNFTVQEGCKLVIYDYL